MINDKQIAVFGEQLKSSELPNEFEILGIQCILHKKVKSNSKNIELSVELDEVKIDLLIRLYLNDTNHYRLFCFNVTGLLFSINLTISNNYENEVLTLCQSIKLSNRSLSVKQKKENQLAIFQLCEQEGIKKVGNSILLGYYDILKGEFIETNPSKFLLDFIKIAIIKGHFMANKGYIISRFDKKTI